MVKSQRLGWIGVDIGTHTVKLAQAVRDGAGTRLHRAAVIQRPTSWTSEELLGVDEPMASQLQIRAALECGRFLGRDAVCSLPMNVCQLRCLNVPPGTDHERRTIIGGELAEEWAELSQPMEYDYWEMETSRGEKASDGFNVSVLATSRPWVSQVFRDCRDSGLDCWAIDGAPLAMARAVVMAGVTSDQRVLAVDWGYSNVTLSVVGDERPLYSRRVYDCAFGRVLDAVMQMFNVTLDEAQHLVDSQGFVIEESDDATDAITQRAITDAAAGPTEEILKQIRRTLQFTEAQRKHLQPTAIWLMGGGAAMRNVGSFLASQLQLPVHVWQLPHNDEEIPCAAGNRSAVFSAAMALSATAWRAA